MLEYPMTKVPNVDFFYRCSDDEHEGLERRGEPRDEPGAGPRDLLNRALLSMCDEVERNNGAMTIEPGKAETKGSDGMRKLRIPITTVDRVVALVGQLPGVSQSQFVREAIRRWGKTG